jgi:trans-aconitate 2-methyltransferase
LLENLRYASPMWNPSEYLKFSDHRDRPFFDLMAQVQTDSPREVADLGCGTGHLTVTLTERFPRAQVWGVDSSAEMLEAAQKHAQPGRLEFVCGDIISWTPPQPLELIVSNAALQWVPNHGALIPRLAGLLEEGGWLAIQMPANFDAPSHSLLKDLTSSSRWKDQLEGSPEPRHSMKTDWYIALLHDLGFRVNAWETTYQQILQGENPVLEWVKGTALRPVLATLEGTGRDEFLREYGARLLEAYPTQAFGTLLPFKRQFIVAQKVAQENAQ